MPYLPIVIMLGFAIFYYRAAEFENEPELVWSGLSVLISATTIFYFHWGFFGALLGQIGLLAGIVFFRMWRER